MGYHALQHDSKIAYETWCRFLDDFNVLQVNGYGLTAISQLVGKERFWADAARQHRSIVEPRDVIVVRKEADRLRAQLKLLPRETPTTTDNRESMPIIHGSTPAETPEKQRRKTQSGSRKGVGGAKPDLSPKQAERVLVWLDELAAALDNSPGLVGTALEMADNSIHSIRMRGGLTSKKTYDRLKSLAEKIKDGTFDPQIVKERRAFLKRHPELAPRRRKSPPRRQSTAAKQEVQQQTDTTEPITQLVSVNNHQTATPMAATLIQKDPFGWMDQVKEGLFVLAARILEEADRVPEGFRGPYLEKSSRLEQLMKEFER